MKQLLIETETVKVVQAKCNWCAEEKLCFQAPHSVTQTHLRNTGGFRQYAVDGLGCPIPEIEFYDETTKVYICQDCARQLMGFEPYAPTPDTNNTKEE